jgi:hypothetical protein
VICEPGTGNRVDPKILDTELTGENALLEVFSIDTCLFDLTTVELRLYDRRPHRAVLALDNALPTAGGQTQSEQPR